MHWLAVLLRLPALDTWHGLERSLGSGWPGLLRVLAGLAAGWWLYVPLHELLHAAACLAAGGEVARLEIAPLYGGALLARVFPFVVAGGDYAGRLSGFSTGGDTAYLATDLGPYLLTLFPGVWALRAAAARGRGLLFGLTLPVALAPFLSLTGDAYEIGSILATRMPPWSDAATRELLRGDDLLLKLGELAGADAGTWSGAATALLLGILWAFLTYSLGAWLARRLGAGPVPAPAPRTHPSRA